MIKLDKKDMAQLTRKINQLKLIDKQGLSTELGKMGLMSVRKMKKIGFQQRFSSPNDIIINKT